MTGFAIFLVLVSAVIHLGWNLVVKREHPTLAFLFLSSACGTLVLAPMLLWIGDGPPQLPPAAWGALAATGLFQLIYCSCLVGAYRKGDLSIAYPLIRSIPPVLVALAAVPLGRAQLISPTCWLGIIAILAGGVLLPMRHFADVRLRNYLNVCCGLSFLSAIGTTGYCLVDDFALRMIRDNSEGGLSAIDAAIVYVPYQLASVVLFLGGSVLFNSSERRNLAAIWRQSKRTAAVAGACMYPSYFLVLIAMGYVAEVSYVVGFRQVSVPLSVLVGITLLGEPRSGPKWLGVLLLFAGVLMVGAG